MGERRTPTTAEVRDDYAGLCSEFGTPYDIALAEFDRWKVEESMAVARAERLRIIRALRDEFGPTNRAAAWLARPEQSVRAVLAIDGEVA